MLLAKHTHTPFWLALPLLGCSVAILAAQDEFRTGATEQQINGLIQQLGASNFAAREMASRQLLSIGEAALPSLRAVPDSLEFEVRHRAKLLRQRIEDDKFDALANSFLLDSNSERSYGLPGWEAYRQIVGSTRTSKLLFLKMIRAQPEVARVIERVSEAATPESIQSLETTAAVAAFRLRERFYTLQEPTIGDSIAMLMAASAIPTQTPVEISDVIVQLERSSFGGNIAKQGYGNCLRKLMSAWLPKTHEAMSATAMTIALQHDLGEGVGIARRHLSANFDPETRKLAFYCMAKFGDESDAPKLIPLLEDAQLVEEFPRGTSDSDFNDQNIAPPGAAGTAASNNMVVRISDLALVTLVLLSDEEPTQFFPNFKPHFSRRFNIRSLATPAESPVEQRMRIEKWKKLHDTKQVAS